MGEKNSKVKMQKSKVMIIGRWFSSHRILEKTAIFFQPQT